MWAKKQDRNSYKTLPGFFFLFPIFSHFMCPLSAYRLRMKEIVVNNNLHM